MQGLLYGLFFSLPNSPMMKQQKKLSIAVLDMYDNHANQGMRCIKEIVRQFAEHYNLDISYHIYDVRYACEMADIHHDIFISTGGPGSPIDSEGSEWESKYFNLLDQIRNHNATNPQQKKHLFLICHSFQLFCRYYKLGNVCKRRSTSFGVMPIHRIDAGDSEPLFDDLPDPFWAVDSRDWQILQPNHDKIAAMGGAVLCIEKYRPHVDLERAVMAIRFDETTFGTQFHPEADPWGMLHYLKMEERKQIVIQEHGEAKYYEMLDHLDDPDKIVLTYNTILPRFLEMALMANKPAETSDVITF